MYSFNIQVNGETAVVTLKDNDIEIRDQESQLIMDLVDQETITDLRKRADNFRERLRRFPPGVKFYAYDEPRKQTFQRRTSLPPVAELDAAQAGPVTAELIDHMSAQFSNFKLTGIYHDGRVVEFEYIYKNDQLHLYRY